MSSHLSTPAKDVAHSLSHSRSPAKSVAIDVSHTPAGTPQKPKEPSPRPSNQSSPLLKGAHVGSTSHAPPQFDIEEAADASKAKATWVQRFVVRPLQTRVVTPMVNILKSGATPEGIALSLAFGFTGGLFPVPATTTVMCVIFVFLFKLNIGAVQIANLLMTPVNLATFITFIRYGEALFGAPPVELSTDAFKSDPIAALGQFWVSLCYGIVAWAIFCVPGQSNADRRMDIGASGHCQRVHALAPES